MATPQAKILVVEDDFDAADATKTVLESAGYQVAIADSPAKAWEAMRAARPDLILLDVMMPSGTEGFHFVWELRGSDNEALREVPIIIMSAIHDTTSLRFYPTEGDGSYAPGEYLPVQAFLDKPAQPQQLLAQVAAVLEGKSPQP
ncbi:MAG TPA: response regulator [Armatimonadota bacterium]|nr:response regulator [Armatimonadota bacterium]